LKDTKLHEVPRKIVLKVDSGPLSSLSDRKADIYDHDG